MTTRLPVAWLNYPGDLTGPTGVLTQEYMGPTLHGERVYPVTASYDPATDRTVVGFSYIAPDTPDAPLSVNPFVAPQPPTR